jgi:hypothetical protein
LRLTPCPAAVRQYSKAAFIAAARAEVAGHKSDKTRWLADFYETAGLTRQPSACFAWCSRSTSSSVSAAKRSRPTSSPGSRGIPISTDCRPCRASGRFWRC